MFVPTPQSRSKCGLAPYPSCTPISGPGPTGRPRGCDYSIYSKKQHCKSFQSFFSGEGVADDSAGLPLAGYTNGAIVYDSHSTRKGGFIFPTGLCSLTKFTERVLTGHLRARGQRRRQLGGPAGSPRQPASRPCLGFTPRIIIGCSIRRR